MPDDYSQISRSYVFGPLGFWTMALLRNAAKFDPFLSLDCAPTPSTLAQSKERKGSNFAIWQHCITARTFTQTGKDYAEKENLKEMGDVTSGMASTVIQVYLRSVLDSYFNENVYVRVAVVKIISLILAQVSIDLLLIVINTQVII